jgi:hypothetical protein
VNPIERLKGLRRPSLDGDRVKAPARWVGDRAKSAGGSLKSAGGSVKDAAAKLRPGPSDPQAGAVAVETAPAAEPSPGPMERLRSMQVPSPWFVGAALLVALWIGWAIFSATDRGADDGLGVLVAWPTLLLMAALVTAPLAAIVFMVARLVRHQRDAAMAEASDGGDGDGENITGRTFPL